MAGPNWVGGHLTALRRTAVGSFRVEDAVELEALEEGPAPAGAWLSPLEALGHLPRRQVSAEEAAALANGRILSAPGEEDQGPLVLVHADELVAVAELRDGRLRPRKVFAPADREAAP